MKEHEVSYWPQIFTDGTRIFLSSIEKSIRLYPGKFTTKNNS